MIRYVPLLPLFLVASPLLAQHPHDSNNHQSYPYGYDYSPWQPTVWSALEYRTKCEGEPVRGMEAGPIRWVVEVRNTTLNLINFSYSIQPPGENKKPAARGRTRAKPRDTVSKLASISTTRCDDGVIIRLDSVRVGTDAAGTDYLQPDRRLP